MNYTRTLRLTNAVLMLIGYQVHGFSSETKRYRLSPWTIGHFIMISVFYLISFAHHLENSALLNLMQVVSPFLHRLISIQLLIGMKVFIYGVYEQRATIRASNDFVSALPKVHAKRFGREEAYAYFLNLSSLFIGLCITIYVADQMDFVLPPVDNILIFCGLFVPHFVLGGSVKLYNIGKWLQRERLLELQWEFQRIVEMPEIKKKEEEAVIELESGSTNAQKIEQLDLSASLKSLKNELNRLEEASTALNASLQRQLVLLLLLNCNCLLAGTYARVYYETSWNAIFVAATRNVFEATNYGLFIMISWDYFTILLTHMLLGNVKNGFLKNLSHALEQREKFTESTRTVLKDIHRSLKNVWSCKVLSMAHIGPRSFVVLHSFVGLTIALIVVYQYLKDQINDLCNRIDGIVADDDDD